MIKLFDPLGALRALGDELQQQAQLAGIETGAELGIDLRASERTEHCTATGVIDRYRLRFAKQKVEISTGGPSRNVISLTASSLAPLVLGDSSAVELADSGNLVPANGKALQLATRLFPGQRWWRPTLDDLLA